MFPFNFNLFTSSNSSATTTASTTSNSSTPSSGESFSSILLRIVCYLLAITITVFIILLFIHYFIKPIFTFNHDASALFNIPGFDKGKLFWNNTNPSTIKNTDLPISKQSFGYSLVIDILIQNPFQFSNYPRLILRRGGTLITPSGTSSTTNTLSSILNNYNLAIALLPDVNDLIISVTTTNNNIENVVIPNITIQEPFRLGVVVLERALEIYVNGKLLKTRAFNEIPTCIEDDIIPFGKEQDMVKLRNLKIWNTPISASEMRYTTPVISTYAEMGGTSMPTSTTISAKK
jgi:hypothetical protein